MIRLAEGLAWVLIGVNAAILYRVLAGVVVRARKS